MSRSWRRRFSAALFADRVAWAVRDGGLRSTIAAQGVERIAAPESGPPWLTAVEALAAALDASGKPRPELAVVLSGQFVRTLLVPWPAGVEEDVEGTALAGHHFQRVFGDDPASWEIAFDRDALGTARLACAVERELLAALRTAADATGVRLVSVTPLLVSSFNLWRRRIARGATLFVLAERGRYCAATLKDGAWTSVRCARLAGEGSELLAEVIEREAGLAGDGGIQVLAYAPELPDFAVSPELAPRLTRLTLGDQPGSPLLTEPAAAFAMGTLV